MTPQDTVTPAQAIILGLLQGLTEFIPVSSSAHLNIAHWLFGQNRELAFDVMLHIGTLLALVSYFWHDWLELLRNPGQRYLRNLVVLACIPAVVLGVLLRDLEETSPLFHDVRFNASMMMLMGLFLWWADHLGRKRRTLERANWKDAVAVGCSQALALIPGVSRSGATITAGLARRLTREAAARFSFLMSLPITAGAVVYEFYGQVWQQGGIEALNTTPLTLGLGILSSAIAGFWAIGFLLNYLKHHGVALFVYWRILVGLAVWLLFPLLR